jgi:hypothetical protein
MVAATGLTPIPNPPQPFEVEEAVAADLPCKVAMAVPEAKAVTGWWSSDMSPRH